MQVREIMTSPAQVIDHNSTIKDLAEKMRSDDLGALPVCDGDRLLGMVTDRDIVTRAVAMDKPLKSASAKEVMSEKVAFVREDDDIQAAERKMSEHRIRRLPVIDRNDKLVGMVTLADIARKTGRHIENTAEEITKPGDQPRKM
ncbi:MAG: CBS domain-containing protein [Pseudomonadota bacterium]